MHESKINLLENKKIEKWRVISSILFMLQVLLIASVPLQFISCVDVNSKGNNT